MNEQRKKEKLIKDENWKQFGNDLINFMKKHKVKNYDVQIWDYSASEIFGNSYQSLDD